MTGVVKWTGGTRMMFVGVKRSLSRIAEDVELRVRMERRLRAEKGRARLPGRLGRLAKEIEEKAPLHGKKS